VVIHPPQETEMNPNYHSTTWLLESQLAAYDCNQVSILV
jgi:hypothetical protein